MLLNNLITTSFYISIFQLQHSVVDEGTFLMQKKAFPIHFNESYQLRYSQETILF